jgi:hypothetical protein
VSQAAIVAINGLTPTMFITRVTCVLSEFFILAPSWNRAESPIPNAQPECLLWVKMRKAHREQIQCALPH